MRDQRTSVPGALALGFVAALLAGLPVSATEMDAKTGLVIAEGFDLVSVHCTVCHSATLVTQNRADREGWLSMIRWMQKKQGLWPLGPAEDPILNYLATNYGPVDSGRRKPLPKHLLPNIK